jgi:hypothetical protein
MNLIHSRKTEDKKKTFLKYQREEKPFSKLELIKLFEQLA